MQTKKPTLKQKKSGGSPGGGASRYAEKVARRRTMAKNLGAPVAPIPVLERGMTDDELAADLAAKAKHEAELARLASQATDDVALYNVPPPDIAPDAHLESSFDERSEIGGDDG